MVWPSQIQRYLLTCSMHAEIRALAIAEEHRLDAEVEHSLKEAFHAYRAHHPPHSRLSKSLDELSKQLVADEVEFGNAAADTASLKVRAQNAANVACRMVHDHVSLAFGPLAASNI